MKYFEEKWDSKYYYAVKSWRNNFDELVTFFNFPAEIRKLIYTTNVIENLNRNIRKIFKNKTSFPTDESLIKIVYFAIQNQLNKWDKVVLNWGGL
ncbi:Transposase and inactivated derivatives [Mycoplasmopsis maculosa]|uniref:Mutator family transposase n=1 Tax=Mycoplasmopsis maculosa TaxID=114885 RepID=A0A449B3T2_9BACT|nr:Transposase and inactivated derivatives [Mycoplasmopsis maculosa]